MSDLDYDALRKVAERASTINSLAAAIGGERWKLDGWPQEAIDHIAEFDPPTVLRLLDLAQRAEAAEAKLREYDRQISWDTTCANCAHLLDKSYADYVRAEKAEAAVERVRQYASHCAILRVEPSTAGLRAALDPRADQ